MTAMDKLEYIRKMLECICEDCEDPHFTKDDIADALDDLIKEIDDWYCADAERRTDGSDRQTGGD